MEKKNFFAPLASGLGAMRRAAMLLLAVLTAATASAQYGALDFWCSGCNRTHNFSEYTVDIHPTCIRIGRASVDYCQVCRNLGLRADIPALGHDWDGYSNRPGWYTVDPTCTKGCYYERICHRCGMKETKPYEFTSYPLGHDWGATTHQAATCTEVEHDEHTCYRCGETERFNITGDALGHDWGATTHQAATCTEVGHDEHTCNRCGVRERFNITGDALGHDFVNSICTRCGKIFPMAFSDDAANDLSPFVGKKTDVTLSGRKIYGDNDWNTLCLPFALTAEQIAASPLSGATIMALDGTTSNLTDGTLTLNFTPVTSIEAGKPYVVRMVKGRDGATAPTYTFTGGNYFSDSDIYNNLMDGRPDYQWACDMHIGPYCEFQADRPVYVTGYTLMTGIPSIYRPECWTLKAKLNEADDWTTIDSRDASVNEDDAMGSNYRDTKTYNILNPSLYKYFRLDVTKNYGHVTLYLSEMTMHSFYPEDAYIVDPTFTEVTLTEAEPVAVTFDNNGTADESEKCRFVGNYSPFGIDDGNIDEIVYLGSNNVIGYATAARTLRNFRAHFEIPTLSGSNSRAMTRTLLDFSGRSGDGNTGIADCKSASHGSEIANSPEQEAWYSLDGRRLSGRPSAKGVYVNNGRKVVIK